MVDVSSRLFISYRREDTKAVAGRVYDRLALALGRKDIFFDVSAVAGGEPIVERIQKAVDDSSTILVFIGSKWLEANPGQQRARIWDQNDYVRLEVRSALQPGKLVIPVLVDNAPMPSGDALPDDIVLITGRHALPLRHITFDNDLETIAKAAVGVSLSELLASDKRSVVLKCLHASLGIAAALVLCLIMAVIHEEAMHRPLDLTIGGAATTGLLVGSVLIGAAVGLRLGRRKGP